MGPRARRLLRLRDFVAFHDRSTRQSHVELLENFLAHSLIDLSSRETDCFKVLKSRQHSRFSSMVFDKPDETSFGERIDSRHKGLKPPSTTFAAENRMLDRSLPRQYPSAWGFKKGENG